MLSVGALPVFARYARRETIERQCREMSEVSRLAINWMDLPTDNKRMVPG